MRVWPNSDSSAARIAINEPVHAQKEGPKRRVLVTPCAGIDWRGRFPEAGDLLPRYSTDTCRTHAYPKLEELVLLKARSALQSIGSRVELFASSHNHGKTASRSAPQCANGFWQPSASNRQLLDQTSKIT